MAEPPWNNYDLARQLSSACVKSRYRDILILLRRGADPNRLESLHTVCWLNHTECVPALMLWGANPGPGRREWDGGLGLTPLHRACYNNNLACVKALLAHHSPTDIKDTLGRTPVACARERQYHKVADFIEGWIPPPRGPLSNYPSIKKLSDIQIESWMQLGRHLGLTEDEIGPIRKTQYPTTYIFLEVKKKDMKRLQWKDVMQAFISIGENELAERVCREEGEGHTVLSVCAYYGWLEFIKRAKEHNLTDPVNDSGDTVLAIACAQGNMALIDYFVKDKGWDLNGSVNKAGQSLRSLAESLQLSEVIKYLDNLKPGIGRQKKYLEFLDKIISDKKNTILLQFLKMYFIGSSGIGKSTTRDRLIGVITNLISLPKEKRKRRSTNLAECNQVMAVMDKTEAKLTLKASGDSDEETCLLFAYVYRHLLTSVDEDDSSAPVISTSSETSKHPVASSDGDAESTASDTQIKDSAAKVAQATIPYLKAKEQTATKVDKVIARFRSIVGSGRYAEQLMNKVLVNLIDIGGQPGFLEMLPFLSRGPGMFLAFFRLDKELENLCEVSYEREDYKITPYKAIYTVREALSQILSAIDHHVAVDATSDQQFHGQLGDLLSMKPIATLVGTFKDKLETRVKTKILNEKITEFSQALESEKEKVHKHALALLEAEDGGEPMPRTGTDIQRSADELLASESFNKDVKDRLDQELEMRNKSISTIAEKFGDLLINPDHVNDQYFIALDNYKGTESDIDPLREHLQTMFTNFFEDKKYRIRPTHLLLGAILRKEYDIVSMDDCIQIGRALSMTEEEVDFAVWYLDQWAGALIYRPEINEWFKKYIICNPQLVFDSISSVIVESVLEIHSPTSKCRFLPTERKNWIEKGQFSLDTVKRCHSEESKLKIKQGKLIPEDKLVKFLQHCNLLSLITSKTANGKREIMCFIPAILECASFEELQKSPPPDIDTPSPIKITFKTGYVPIGIFCALISQLVSRGSTEEDILGMTWELVESGVKRNLVSFRIDSVEHIVTLVAHADCYELRVIRQHRDIILNDLCS